MTYNRFMATVVVLGFIGCVLFPLFTTQITIALAIIWYIASYKVLNEMMEVYMARMGINTHRTRRGK